MGRLLLEQIDPGGATDQQGLIYDDATGLWVPADVVKSVVEGTGIVIDNTDPANPIISAGAAADTWDLILDLPLSTLTGWTAGSGSWSIASGVIKQATTTAAVYRLRYTAARIPVTHVIAEFETKLKSPSGVSSRTGIVFGAGFTSDTTRGLLTAVIVNSGVTLLNGANWEDDAVNSGPVVTISPTIAFDTWFKMKVVKAGSDADIYIDDVYVGSGTIAQPNREQGTIALYAYGAETYYRNLKVWTPVLP